MRLTGGMERKNNFFGWNLRRNLKIWLSLKIHQIHIPPLVEVYTENLIYKSTIQENDLKYICVTWVFLLVNLVSCPACFLKGKCYSHTSGCTMWAPKHTLQTTLREGVYYSFSLPSAQCFFFFWQYWRVEWGLNLGRMSDRWAIAPRPIFLKFKQEVVFLWILNLFLKSKNNYHIASTGT